MSTDIRAYREFYKLSQAEMGKILKLAKSTISMVEANERKLPAEAREIFEQLQAGNVDDVIIASENHSELDLEEVRKLNNDLCSTSLEEYKKECELALHQYEMKLHRLKKRYDKAMARYLLANECIAKATGKEQEFPPNYGLQQKMVSIRALRTLLHIGSHKPMEIMVKIEGLKASLNAMRNILNRPEKEEGSGLPFEG